jgi:hypothetical protein
MIAALLAWLSSTFASSIGEALSRAFADWRRDRALVDKGRIEVSAEAEAQARALQQDITEVSHDRPTLPDLAARARAGGL